MMNWAIGSKLGIEAKKKLPGEGFKRPWPPAHQGGSSGGQQSEFAVRKHR